MFGAVEIINQMQQLVIVLVVKEGYNRHTIFQLVGKASGRVVDYNYILQAKVVSKDTQILNENGALLAAVLSVEASINQTFRVLNK